ncbi:MAG: UvrD-helicase domain-containing protein [Neisseriales bacterium]|nr:MAG: UvrD-helicase domain-containing protein [Neisseriales bacterium]
MTRLDQFRPTLLLRLFNKVSRNIFLATGRYFLTVKLFKKTYQIPYEQIKDIETINFLIWKKIRFKLTDKKELSFDWIKDNIYKKLKDIIYMHRKATLEFINNNNKNAELIKACTDWYLGATRGERWISYREVEKFVESKKELQYLWDTETSDLLTDKMDLINHINNMNEIRTDKDAFRIKCNAQFEKQELIRYKTFFDNLPARLTLNQRKAVIVNEDLQLIVAAAGSGKTTTIKSKVAYLIDKGLVRPHELLIIAFNKDIQEELERSLTKTYSGITIKTFHAFGLEILAEIDNHKPSLSKLSEDPISLLKYLEQSINEIYQDKYLELTEFFVSYAKPYRDQFDFKNMGEYISYVKSVEPVTLKGEYVRSLEELDIANFFYINGIDYLYEKNTNIK